MILRFGMLTIDELRQIADLKATSPEAQRISSLALSEWFERVYPRNSNFPRGERGKWTLLEWFCREERIMTPDELAAALARYQAKEAA